MVYQVAVRWKKIDLVIRRFIANKAKLVPCICKYGYRWIDKVDKMIDTDKIEKLRRI